MKFLFYILVLFQFLSAAHSYENRCSRNKSYERVAKSKCIGGKLPRNKLRNMKKRSHKIVCSGNASTFVRRPQKLNYEEWETWLEVDANKAQDYARKSLKPIKWAGTASFKTIETWKWEDCELVTSSYHCGTKTEYYTEIEHYTDSQGRSQSRPVQKHREVAKTCYADIEHTEYDLCSSESVKYTSEFIRPKKSEWNPATPGYYNELPLKYDLLPGEVEAIQTYSSSQTYGSNLSPVVKIPSAWNKYNINISRPTLSCDQLKAKGLPPHEISVKIKTIGRDTSHKSPNAFRLPVDFDGERMDALLFASAKDRDGKFHEKAYPRAIQLLDTASAMTNLIAEQSRQNEQVAKAKHEQGKFTNKDGTEVTDLPEDSSFFKNTKVKVSIIDKNNMWFDNHFGTIRTEDVNTVQASLNSISENQTIARSDLWLIKLNGDKEGESDIYEGYNLKPNKDDYYIQVSMYQKGVPFYLQSCEDDKSKDKPFFQCNRAWRAIGFGRKEKHYYSEPLEIKIPTSEYDNRSFFQKFKNLFGYK